MSTAVKELIALEKAADGFGIELGRFLRDVEQSFRGISIIISDRGGYLAILKQFDSKGAPVVLFAAGESPIECLRAANSRLQDGTWRTDAPRNKGK